MSLGPFVRRVFARSVLLFLSLPMATTAGASDILPPGFRPKPVGVHALVGGKVVIKPGEVLEGATIVIRGGYFESVGKNVPPPADARVWDMSGLTIYAGFIEPYLPLGQTNQPISTTDSEPVNSRTLAAGGVNFFGAPGQRTDSGRRGPGYEVSKVTPEVRAVRNYTPDQKTITPLRELGFTSAVVAPSRGIVRGTSALVELAEQDPNEVIVKPDVFQVIAFETQPEDEGAYPGSLMGAIAVVRQSIFDAQHYAQFRWGEAADEPAREDARPTKARPEFNPSLSALIPAATGKQRVLFEPGSALMVDRAARVARELKLDFAIVSCGQEWRRPDLAKETGATFIVPVDFPTLPKLPSEDDWKQVTLDQLRAWDWAAENPALLRQQKLDIALTTYSLKDRAAFRKNVRRALDRGLSETDALAALTTIPAKLCGVDQQLGTIEPGKIANLTIVDGKGYFDPESRVREVWVDGRNFHVQSAKEVAKKDDGENGEKAEKGKADNGKKEAELKELQSKRVAHLPLEGRGPLSDQSTRLLHDATIWTCATAGILTNGELMIANGKISRVSTIPGNSGSARAPSGRHITPGLIDAHSHSAILGAVNESTLPSTAMVRIGDVVNSETRNIQDELAGGLTTANLLHGSANPIGGQNQIIKLRDGAGPEEMNFEGAPPGIKFALGENVKQSNWGENLSESLHRRAAILEGVGRVQKERWRCPASGSRTRSPRRDHRGEAVHPLPQLSAG